jgi:hypothetical protein
MQDRTKHEAWAARSRVERVGGTGDNDTGSGRKEGRVWTKGQRRTKGWREGEAKSLTTALLLRIAVFLSSVTDNQFSFD